jgi:predicted permease
MSVRVALGATPWSLARHVLSESLVLSLAGAALGFGFAYWGSQLLVAVMTKEYLTPVALDLRPDFRVLFLTLAVATLTGILFGLAPAWRSSREDPAVVLQQGSRSVAGGASGFGKALIVAQVALSLVLLLGAGLLLRSFLALRSVNTGFARESVLEVTLNPRPGVPQNVDLDSYHRQLTEGVTRIPGVRSVAFADDSVPNNERASNAVASSSAEVSINTGVVTNGMMVSPGFFATVGIPVERGHEFTWADDQQHPHVALVNASLAKKLFPNGDAIGQRVRFGFMPELQNLEIVGIAGDARLFDLRATDAPVIYLPELQHGDSASWSHLFVRANETPDALARSVGHEIESFGREYVFRSRTVSEVIDQALIEERVIAALSGFFALLALLLASVGLYGLMSYAVTRRTREMGIRVALGAQSTTVLGLVLRETVALVLAGIAVGIPCGLAATHLIASMLFGLSANDVPTIAGVAGLLILVALIAGFLPARRAARIDPMIALRSE